MLVRKRYGHAHARAVTPVRAREAQARGLNEDIVGCVC
ncbi:unnamed protein product, partial [marine sediment metagenome]